MDKIGDKKSALQCFAGHLNRYKTFAKYYFLISRTVNSRERYDIIVYHLVAYAIFFYDW